MELDKIQKQDTLLNELVAAKDATSIKRQHNEDILEEFENTKVPEFREAAKAVTTQTQVLVDMHQSRLQSMEGKAETKEKDVTPDGKKKKTP